MKKKVLGIIVVLLIIIAIIVGLYVKTDLFKTSEQLFYKHLTSNLLGKMGYEDMIEEFSNNKNLSMEKEGEITAKIETDDASMKSLANALEKAKIKYNQKIVSSEQKMQSNIKLSYNQRDVIDLNLLQNKEQYGVKIDELYNKYVSVENNNLKSVFEKLGMDTTNIPEKFEQIDIYELLEIDNKTLNSIKTTLYGIIKENIGQEAYSVEKNVTVKIDDSDVITNTYKLTVKQEQMNNIAVKVLETVKNDDKILELIIEKNNILKDNIINKEELTKEQLIKVIEDKISQINNKIDENTTFDIIVYGEVDKKSKIEIIEKVEDKEVSKTELQIIRVEDNIKKIIMSNEEDNVTTSILVSYEDTKSEIVIKAQNKEDVIELNIKEEVKSTENISIEEFNSDNSVKLNDMTETEIQQLIGKIYLNALYSLPQKVQILGIDVYDLMGEDNEENTIIDNEVENNTTENNIEETTTL